MEFFHKYLTISYHNQDPILKISCYMHYCWTFFIEQHQNNCKISFSIVTKSSTIGINHIYGKKKPKEHKFANMKNEQMSS